MAYSFSGSQVTGLASDVIASAYSEINVVPPGETVPTPQATWGLEKLQRIIDQWNAIEEAIFAVSFSLFNLTANHAPHTIGPTGDFSYTLRPMRLTSASFVLNGSSSNPVDLPINIRDKEWWAANPLKSLTSAIITDVYYDPTLPNGTLNFYPICTTVSPVRLELWTTLTQAVLASTSLGFAPGYWKALVLTLASELAPNFGSAALQAAAAFEGKRIEALRVIFGNNNQPPRIRTDGGMPSDRNSRRPDFDFLTGLNDNY